MAGRIQFTVSSFGGGWLVPLDSTAEEAARDYFGEDATEQPALGGAVGWIVEPHEALDAIQGFMALGLEVML